MGQSPVPKPLHHDERRTLKDILQLQDIPNYIEEKKIVTLSLSLPSSGNISGEKLKKRFIKLRRRGLSLASRGAIDKAIDNYRAAISMLADLESSLASANNEEKGHIQTLTQSIYAEVGNLLFEHGRAGALECYTKALKHREGERTIDVVAIYFSMGRIYRDNGELDQSLACYHRCLDAHVALLDSRDRMHLIPVLYNLGCLHLLRGEIAGKNAKLAHDDCSTIFSSASVNTCGSQVQCEYYLALRFFREALALQDDALDFIYVDTLHYLGSLCARLSMPDEALEYFTRELNMIRNDPEHAEKVVEVLRAVAALIYSKKQFAYAIQILEEASVLLRSFLGNDDVDLARNLARTGYIYHKINDHENAVSCVEEAVRVMRVNCMSQEYPFAKLCRRLGNLYASINDYDNAVKNYEEALSIQQQALGREHIENFHTLRRLGNAHFLKNKLQLALSCYVEGLRIWRQEPSHNSRSKVAPVLRKMGFIFFTQKKYNFSLRCYLDALESYETDEHLHDRADEICELYNNVGNVYLTINDFDEAVKYYESALSIKLSLLGKNHIDTTGTMCNLGQAHVGLGNFDEALDLYNQALNIREKHGKNHKNVGQVCNEIGNIYIKLKRYGKAQIFLQRSLRGKRQSASNDPAHIENELITLSNLGHLFFKKDQYLKALEMYQSVLSKAYTTESLLRASTLHSMGNVSMKTGELDSALRYFFRSLAMKKKLLGSNDKSVLRTLHNIGIVYREMGDFGKAEDYFEESVLMSNRVNCDQLEIARVMTDAGRVYLATKQFLQAKTTFDYIDSTLSALPYQEYSDNLEHLKKTVIKLEKAASAGLQMLSSAKNNSSLNTSHIDVEEY